VGSEFLCVLLVLGDVLAQLFVGRLSCSYFPLRFC